MNTSSSSKSFTEHTKQNIMDEYQNMDTSQNINQVDTHHLDS
jgi:ribosome biogenesis protein Tsr3